MALLDIFDDDAFSVHSLTAAVDKLPFMPGRIGRMGLFTPMPITTSIAIVEERHGKLTLLPTKPRGSEQQTSGSTTPTRKIRSVPVPHVPHWDTVLAGDLEGKRAFGSEDQTEIFSQILNDRLQSMKDDHEVTREWHRVRAIQGAVLDADGVTEVVNWFDEFGITELEIQFDFSDAGDYDNADPAMDMKERAQQVKRMMKRALGGTTFTGIHAFCGNGFFDSFVGHATVRRAYERYQENTFARELQDEEGGFKFAGITWENYDGYVGEVNFFEDDECRFIPTGVRNVFVAAMAPADFIETVNTRGQEIYAKQERMKWDKGIELHTQSNVLYMCTRPRCLIKGVASNLTSSPTTTPSPTPAPTTT